MHRTSSRFWKCFDKLPFSIQKTANESFELLKDNIYHPSLHFKKIGSFWSVRIDLNYRSLAIEDGEDFIWVWIGKYDEYERMLILCFEIEQIRSKSVRLLAEVNSSPFLIENLENERLLSIASLWEMSIKASIGKLKLANFFMRCRTH